MNQDPARCCTNTEWKKTPGNLCVRHEITERKNEKIQGDKNKLICMIE